MTNNKKLAVLSTTRNKLLFQVKKCKQNRNKLLALIIKTSTDREKQGVLIPNSIQIARSSIIFEFLQKNETQWRTANTLDSRQSNQSYLYEEGEPIAIKISNTNPFPIFYSIYADCNNGNFEQIYPIKMRLFMLDGANEKCAYVIQKLGSDFSLLNDNITPTVYTFKLYVSTVSNPTDEQAGIVITRRFQVNKASQIDYTNSLL